MRARIPIFIATGLVLILTSGLTYVSRHWGSGPGRLEPDETQITWHSPPPIDGRYLHKMAAANFTLTNTGGTEVRIKSAESGCGCARPVVEPSVIPPGEKGTVSVKAIPLPIGERIVPITLNTDSPLTPAITLHLRMVGSRPPPFLLRASGDLGFLGEISTSDVREVVAITIEESEGDRKEPLLESDLPLVFEKQGERTAHYTESGIVSHRYTYRVRSAKKPPAGTFKDELRVIDPWDSSHVESIPVLGQSVPTLRAIPSEIILELGKAGGPVEPSNLSIITKGPLPELVIEPEGDDVPIEVRRRTVQEASNRLQFFSVDLKPGETPVPGTLNLIVRSAPDSDDHLVVPVVIRKGDAP